MRFTVGMMGSCCRGTAGCELLSSFYSRIETLQTFQNFFFVYLCTAGPCQTTFSRIALFLAIFPALGLDFSGKNSFLGLQEPSKCGLMGWFFSRKRTGVYVQVNELQETGVSSSGGTSCDFFVLVGLQEQADSCISTTSSFPKPPL